MLDSQATTTERLIGDTFPGTLAANDRAAVIIDIGRSYYSLDGTTWQPATGFGEDEVGSWPAASGGPNGFVAASFESNNWPNGPNTPWVWHSADGQSWARIPPAGLPEPQVRAINSVVAGPDGFLISVQAHPGGQHTLWFSEDGRDWRPTDMPAGSMPLSMANDGSGWMALSHSHLAGEPSMVYESADGVSWTEVEDVQEAPEDFVLSRFDRDLGGPRLVGRDGTWVIAQELFETLGSVAWTSTDDGRTWDRWTLAEDEDARIHDLVVIEDVIVAIGWENKSGAPTKLYYSEDAETWQSVRPIHDLHDLDWLGGNLIALGDGGGGVFAWSNSAEQAPPD